jgi:biopolymer transport protein ExbD
VVVNVKTDGSVIVNRRTLTGSELGKLLQDLVKLYPEQAVVIRGDESGAYKNVVNILNICSEAGITNVAFATAK